MIDISGGVTAGAGALTDPAIAFPRPPLEAWRRLDVQRIEEWLDGAQPGAQLVYYSGHRLAEAPERIRERLYAEAERGMVHLLQRRRGGVGDGFDYFAVRSSRPAVAGRTRPRPSLHDEAGALFRRGGER